MTPFEPTVDPNDGVFRMLARLEAPEPSAMRAPEIRPPLAGKCAASVITEPPFGLMRAILR